MERVGVCVSSHDANYDVWDIFFHFMKKNWNTCHYPLYLTTETKSFCSDFFDIQVINDFEKKDSWSKRLIKALEQIPEEYVLIIFDDFYILSEVKNSDIEFCANIMDDNKNIACFHFCHMAKSEGAITPIEFTKYKKRNAGWGYWVNFLPGLWRKEALIKLLSPYENPWQAEWFGTIRAKLSKWDFYTLSETEKPVLDFEYGITADRGYGLCKGKWTLPTKALFEKEGISIDMDKRGFCDPQKIITTIEYPKMLFRHRWNYFVYGGIDAEDLSVTDGQFRIPILTQLRLIFCHPRSFMKILKKKLDILFEVDRGKTFDSQTGQFVK